MKIQTNTYSAIDGSEQMAQDVRAVAESVLDHVARQITRVEIHISDENSKKGGDHDKRCTMEARLKGHRPIAVKHLAQTVDQAIRGAAGKLKHSLDHTLGRLRERRVSDRQRYA